MQGSYDRLRDCDLLSDKVYYSPAWFAMFGYAADALPGGLQTWENLVHPSEKRAVMEQVQRYLSGAAPSFEVEMRMSHRDGHDVTVLSRAHTVLRSKDNVPIRLVGTHIDLTECRELEPQLAQSQKMESVGRLVGGIAHYFNNVLAALRGNSYLAKQALTDASYVTAKLTDIDNLIERAAQMVNQLLTFSRKYSVKRPASR